MQTFLLLLCVFFTVIQQVGRKEYNRRNSDGAYTFSFGGVVTTIIYFAVVSGGNLKFPAEALIYAAPFSICYALAYFFTMKAIQTGPLSITSLIISYSLIIPTLYGVIALSEPFTLTLMIAVILLMISLALVEGSGKNSRKTISLKWAVYAGITFLSNGVCATIQKVFQANYQGAYSNSFMLISLLLTAVLLGICALLRERDAFPKYIKKGLPWFGICGVGNGAANQITMILAVDMSASVLYPVLSGGGVILTVAISLLIYRERLSLKQWIGLIFGIAAVIILS